MTAHILTPADLTAALDNPWAIFLAVIVASLIAWTFIEYAVHKLGLRRGLERVEPVDDVQDFMQQRREGWR